MELTRRFAGAKQAYRKKIIMGMRGFLGHKMPNSAFLLKKPGLNWRAIRSDTHRACFFITYIGDEPEIIRF